MTAPSRPRANGWLAFGALLTVLVVLAGGVSVAATLSLRSEDSDETYRRPVDRIELDLGSGDVTVTVGAADEIVVHRHLTWSFTKPTFSERWEGDMLRVTTQCHHFVQLGHCGVDYTLTVPAAIAAVLHSGSGDISLRDVTGEAILSTGSGDISVVNLSGPRLTLETGSGDIRAAGVTVPEVRVDTGSGDVDLAFTGRPRVVVVESGSGDVEATVPPGGSYRVATDTGSGDVNVGVQRADGAAASMTIRTGSGDIDLSYA